MASPITLRDILNGAESTAAAKRLQDLLNTHADQLQFVADVTALKAIAAADRVDKGLAFAEDVLQLFAFDAGSVAAEVLGPPATVVQPTAGTGRWIALTTGGSSATQAYVDARVRLAASTAAIKALDVTTLVDKAIVVKEDTGQVFLYDSGSAVAEVLGPPAYIIAPTAGAGRYIDVAFQGLEKRLRVCADDAAVKALDVTTLADKALVYKEDSQQLFAYDSGNADAEALGPPATVIQPTAGAGRYLALTLGGSAQTKAAVDAQVAAAQAAAKSLGFGFFGDGSDGAAVFLAAGGAVIPGVTDNGGGSYTLDRDVFLTTCTIEAGALVEANGFRIYATGAVVIDGGLANDGQDGVAGGAGAVAGSLVGGAAGGADKVGAGAGNAGSATTASMGGAGGAGGDDDGVPTNAGGAAGAKTAPTAAQGSARHLPAATLGCLFGVTGATPLQPGAGGGSGGAAAGSTGGAGGGGGGIVLVCARSITVGATGVVQANGGAGKDGVGAAGGGGGGGGGGAVLLVGDAITVTAGGTVAAAGGAGGAPGAAPATAGAAGAAGTVLQIELA